MMTFLAVLQVLACLIVIAAVLLQPAQNSSGAFTSNPQTMMGNSGGTNFLFKTTMTCGAFLALSSLFMSFNKIHDSKSSVIDRIALPAAPVNPSTSGINPTQAPPHSDLPAGTPTK